MHVRFAFLARSLASRNGAVAAHYHPYQNLEAIVTNQPDDWTTKNFPPVPIEETGVLTAAAVLVMRSVVAELVRRSPVTDRDQIETMLEALAKQVDALNTDRSPGPAEVVTRHLHNQVRLLLGEIRAGNS
jgi:hypothetical protein